MSSLDDLIAERDEWEDRARRAEGTLDDLRAEVTRTLLYVGTTARELEQQVPDAAGVGRTIALLRDIAAGLRRALDSVR